MGPRVKPEDDGKGGVATLIANVAEPGSLQSTNLPHGELVEPRTTHLSYTLTRSAFGSYIGFSEASAFTRSPAISIS
ncbi:hypothetical protein SAMN05443582_10938 [Phyllobacterium sp. OV277]|nr:hypothetical protein SAMN05443582_10938 [Phyllobacterium sp. OV277]